MNNSEFIKFASNKEYTIKLDFDRPLSKDSKFDGKSNLYSGTMDSKDVKFYASPGLHDEIQHQGHKTGSTIIIKKMMKPGEDYSIFTVNGTNSTHNVGDPVEPKKEKSVSTASVSASPNDIDFIKTKVKELEDRIKKIESGHVPF